jgi:hypothetical protein
VDPVLLSARSKPTNQPTEKKEKKNDVKVIHSVHVFASLPAFGGFEPLTSHTRMEHPNHQAIRSMRCIDIVVDR